MTLLGRLKQHLSEYNNRAEDTDPAKAYNLWSQSYDAQPDNLMLALDEEIFAGLLSNISLKNKTIIDIGCGTGRHWGKMMLQKPHTLLGYDVSIGMLNKLKDKYPDAAIYHLQNNLLPELANEQCDVIISTLTIAHIQHIDEAFTEWRRVLKPQGDIIITDYHPEALAKGGNRTFTYEGKTIAIKNYIHRIEKIKSLAKNRGFELLQFEERVIDDSMKHFYEEKNALPVFDKFKNVPIIYGMRLRKQNVTPQPANDQ